MKKDSLDFVINGKMFEYDKLDRLYWRDLMNDHDLEDTDEKYLKFFKENTNYFRHMKCHSDCSCGYNLEEKDLFYIECYETDDFEFIAKGDKDRVYLAIKNEENPDRTCEFTLVICPNCEKWYGYYEEGYSFFYDEEFGKNWRELAK